MYSSNNLTCHYLCVLCFKLFFVVVICSINQIYDAETMPHAHFIVEVILFSSTCTSVQRFVCICLKQDIVLYPSIERMNALFSKYCSHTISYESNCLKARFQNLFQKF